MRTHFFIDTNKRFVKISFMDIIYIEACSNFVRIITCKSSYMALIPLRQLEALLPTKKFCRIHRSYIVSIDHIESFVSNKVYIQDKVLPIGETYSKTLQQRITIVTRDYPRDYKKLSHVLGVRKAV